MRTLVIYTETCEGELNTVRPDLFRLWNSKLKASVTSGELFDYVLEIM